MVHELSLVCVVLQVKPYAIRMRQQGTSIRTRQNPDNRKETVIETLYMRPIFNGATADSSNTHRTPWWLNKWGTEDRQVLALGAS